WVLGTWWIPLLIALGVWRHIVNHYPFTYDPQMWGMAFPIAMYTVGTTKLSIALDLGFLMIIPYTTIFAAIGVWLAILVGMVFSLMRKQLRRMEKEGGPSRAALFAFRTSEAVRCRTES